MVALVAGAGGGLGHLAIQYAQAQGLRVVAIDVSVHHIVPPLPLDPTTIILVDSIAHLSFATPRRRPGKKRRNSVRNLEPRSGSISRRLKI